MDSREVLEREIVQLEAQIRPRKAALSVLNRFEALTERLVDSPSTRFFNARPLDAIRGIEYTAFKNLLRQVVKVAPKPASTPSSFSKSQTGR
jgi:hypothetical protein